MLILRRHSPMYCLLFLIANRKRLPEKLMKQMVLLTLEKILWIVMILLSLYELRRKIML